MTDKIRGAPPPRSGPRMQVLRVTTTEKQRFTCISAKVFGQWIHFHGGRSTECTYLAGDCDKCVLGWSRKWKGYIHCISWRPERECYVELTPSACELLALATVDRQSLRGVVIDISKSKGGAKGRYYIDRLDQLVPEGNLPPESDPLPTLRYLWTAKKEDGR